MLLKGLKSMALGAVALIAAAGAAWGLDTPVVTIAQGQLVGEVRNNANAYWGIPYAAPPVDDLRWKAPGPAPSWTGVRQVKTYGKRCVQSSVVVANQSEDCLYINVWTPRTTGGPLKPVVVWYHGGGFVGGNGEYGGDTFTRDGVVFVAMNYRVGPMGGFAHPALQSEIVPGQPHSNYGLMDQIAALNWVRQNIQAFGGDPNKVTIMGESAGGTSIVHLMASPLTENLFRGAVAQSGVEGLVPNAAAYTYRGAVPPLSERGVKLTDALGLSNPTAAELRDIPATTLVAVNSDKTLALFLGGPVVDGVSLPDGVNDIFTRGEQRPVPLIAGVVSFESSLLEGALGLEFSPTTVAYINNNQTTLQTLYQTTPSLTNTNFTREFATDLYFQSQMRFVARSMNAVGSTGYFYYFDYDLVGCRNTPGYYGVKHGTDLLYTFDSLSAISSLNALSASALCGSTVSQTIQITVADKLVSYGFHGYLVNFIKNGTPNASGFANWQPITPSAHRTMRFNNLGNNTVTNLFKARIDNIEANAPGIY